MKNFVEIIKNFANTKKRQKYLAEKFEVAVSTILKWANGTARPHPRIQKLIIEEVGKYK